MNKYLLHGSLVAKEEQANELADILIEASKLVSTAKGCKLYVISKDANNVNAVFVTEIWDSKEDHDNSLKVEGVRELILKVHRRRDRSWNYLEELVFKNSPRNTA